MHLVQYLHKNRIRHRTFARLLGMSPNGFGLALRREWFSRGTLERIVQVTDGQVTPNDFFDIPAILAAKPETQEAADEAA